MCTFLSFTAAKFRGPTRLKSTEASAERRTPYAPFPPLKSWLGGCGGLQGRKLCPFENRNRRNPLFVCLDAKKDSPHVGVQGTVPSRLCDRVCLVIICIPSSSNAHKLMTRGNSS